MKTLRQMLGISWQEHRTNESILQETGYTRELVSNIKKKKLRYLGQVARKNDSLEKLIIEGMVEGKRRRGRPRKTSIDDVIQWTGLSVKEMIRLAKERTQWRNIVRNAA